MLVYFLRHAEAEDDAGSDFVRQLTPKGLEQAHKTGKFMCRLGITPDVIITSPVVRARQTAEIVAKALDAPLEEGKWLECGMAPTTCLGELTARDDKSAILLVGHEPDFSETIASLIGLPDPDGLKIRKSSLTAIELPGFSAGSGQLQFLVPARLM